MVIMEIITLQKVNFAIKHNLCFIYINHKNKKGENSYG